jgi:Ca-activated chloride channel family protein
MYRYLTLAAVFLAASITPAWAQGWVEIENPRQPGLPTTVTRVSSQVRTTVEGRVARFEVEEQFRNTGGGIAEGSYLYPLPGEAVFQNFSLWMGDQEVRGEMMNAEQARGIYETIVRKLRDPALLTLAGHGLVRAQVFPIQPGETRKVVLRYTQLLDRSGDALRLRYAVGQRGSSSLAFRIAVTRPDEYGVPFSPTHHLNTQRINNRLEVTLDPDASGDLELFLPLQQGLVGTSVVTHAPLGEDGYYMLLLSPPQTEQAAVVPRDLSFVIDVSGSMSGEKLDQAKSALLQALGTLGAGDRFRLIAFSNWVRPFREGFTPATPENLQAARGFVNQLVAEGGTNIAGALDAVLGATVSEERLPIILFLTDGLPSVGEQAPDRIAASASARIGRARIFTVGLGHDVNTYLLDRLAREGRGTAEYVAPGANVEVAIGNLVGKIRRPALVNLRITNAPVDLRDGYPGVLPDLFYGEELVVFGRYRGHGTGQVVVEGERNGRRERFTATADFPSSENGNDFVPRLWASRRIGELTRQIRLEGASQNLIDQVRELGLRYGILTEYTSYLVQEPTLAVRPELRDDQLLRGGAAAAPAQTGVRAFESAKASAQLSGATNLAAADAVADHRLSELESKDGGPAVRRVGGRLFAQRGSVWTDAAHRDSLPVVTVAPFSDAYFALARALPEVVPCLTAGDEVLIAGKKVSIKITAAGARTLPASDLATLVRSFRGA